MINGMSSGLFVIIRSKLQGKMQFAFRLAIPVYRVPPVDDTPTSSHVTKVDINFA